MYCTITHALKVPFRMLYIHVFYMFNLYLVLHVHTIRDIIYIYILYTYTHTHTHTHVHNIATSVNLKSAIPLELSIAPFTKLANAIGLVLKKEGCFHSG